MSYQQHALLGTLRGSGALSSADVAFSAAAFALSAFDCAARSAVLVSAER